MNRFTTKQRTEIVTLYIENSRSVVLTQRAYRQKYRGQQPPSDNTIRRLVSNFLEHGTVEDRPHAAHQRSRRSNELVEAVRESVAENPHVSYRHRAQHFGVSGTTLRRILKDDLQYTKDLEAFNANEDGAEPKKAQKRGKKEAAKKPVTKRKKKESEDEGSKEEKESD